MDIGGGGGGGGPDDDCGGGGGGGGGAGGPVACGGMGGGTGAEGTVAEGTGDGRCGDVEGGGFEPMAVAEVFLTFSWTGAVLTGTVVTTDLELTCSGP